MDRALWLLLWLRFRSWFRRLGRAMRTPKGIALAFLGFLLFVPMLISVVLTSVVSGPHVGDPQMAREYGPLLLLGYCLSIVLFSSADRGLTFTPAEVDFLFPGPFSRRQLLAYKIVGTLLAALFSTILLTLFFQTYAVRLVAALVGLFLITMFLQLFNIAAALVAGTLGVFAYNRARKILLVAFGLVLLGVFLPLGRQALASGGGDFIERMNASPVAAVLLAPFHWFVNAFTAERIWPDLVEWALLALMVNANLLIVVFALDAQYLEAAAGASERLYARLQRMRQGGIAIQQVERGPVRLSLPTVPWWGGAGPMMWRQALAALRGMKGVVVFLAVISMPMLTLLVSGSGRVDALEAFTGVVLISSALVLPSMVPFDFRGDLDRMAELKALPLPAGGLVLGQLAVPVAISSFIQLLLLAVLAAIDMEGRTIAVYAVGFVLPFNFLFYAVENLVFLAYPTRMVPSGPGDFQHLGRHVLVMAIKGMLLMAVALVLAVAGTIAYFVLGRSWVGAAIVVCSLLAGACAGLVPLLVFFFRRFDVSRDTPP